MANLYREENRVSVADGLRGFAIIAITLLHSINHFNLYLFPQESNSFLQLTDSIIKAVITSASSGKSYGVFALLFGFTFFLQLSHQEKRGNDFNHRFIWRMYLLFLIGTVNSAFFAGEILVLYSIIGLILVPLRRVRNRNLIIIAIAFLLQPLILAKIVYILSNHNYTQNFERYIPDKLFNRLEDNTFTEMILTNLTLGKEIYWLSIISNCERIFQTIAFFIFGMLLGREKLFIKSPRSGAFWKKALGFSIISFFILKGVQFELVRILPSGPLDNMVENILNLWSDFATVIFITAIFMKIYSGTKKVKIRWIEPIGKMSLTNYIIQSILGSFLFYGYGLALSKYFGVTFSFIIGLFILLIQFVFSSWWLKHHKKGPVEQLWHQLTWIKFRR